MPGPLACMKIGLTVLKVGKESTRPVTLEISVSYKPQLTHAENNTGKSKRDYYE